LLWVGLVVGDFPLFGCDRDGPGFADGLGVAEALGVGDGATGLGVGVGSAAVEVALGTVADGDATMGWRRELAL
jgi:hypothetical protein